MTGPFGEFTIPPDPIDAATGPLILASAGIGITPIAAMLRGLLAQRSARPVTVLHVARDRNDLALWPEAAALAGQLRHGRAELFLTRAQADPKAQPGVHHRRPGPADWARLTQPGNAENLTALLCGPRAFLRETRDTLLSLGAAPDRIHIEVFTSPTARAGAPADAPLPGPFRVHFTASNTEATWRGGSLLDLAETAGLVLPAACRAGACGTCSQAVTEGSTAYTTEPVLTPSAPAVLLCCAVPTSNVTVEA